MRHFRKVWTDELNAWLLTTKGIANRDAYELFLKTFPEITDVTRTAFCNQRSRVGAAGKCHNSHFSRKPRPLYAEHTKKGYVRIKIAQPNVWMSKAKWVYQETHPWEDLTERSNYVFLDGDSRNFHPDNIERVLLKHMGIFNHLGGCEAGYPEITKLRILQARLKSRTLDKLEELGGVHRYKGGYRADKQKRHEYYLRKKAEPDYKEKCRKQARNYLHRLKIERPEKYREILKKNND